MPTAPSFKPSPKLSLRLAVFGLAVVGLIGGAILHRAPDDGYRPQLAQRPVILEDGTQIQVQRHEVTVAEWNMCHDQGACTQRLRARPDHDAATTPATGLSYLDAQEFLGSINRQTDQTYRLPTANEWDAMAASVLPEAPDPLFTDPSLTWASSYLIAGEAPRALKPQGSFSTSPEGIADLDGSVWEWTQDCYMGASEGVDLSRCPAFFVGGEHVAAMSYLIRDPARGGCAVGTPPAHLGMRLVADAPSKGQSS